MLIVRWFESQTSHFKQISQVMDNIQCPYIDLFEHPVIMRCKRLEKDLMLMERARDDAYAVLHRDDYPIAELCSLIVEKALLMSKKDPRLTFGMYKADIRDPIVREAHRHYTGTGFAEVGQWIANERWKLTQDPCAPETIADDFADPACVPVHRHFMN